MKASLGSGTLMLRVSFHSSNSSMVARKQSMVASLRPAFWMRSIFDCTVCSVVMDVSWPSMSSRNVLMKLRPLGCPSSRVCLCHCRQSRSLAMWSVKLARKEWSASSMRPGAIT